jgi:hypothetical protein
VVVIITCFEKTYVCNMGFVTNIRKKLVAADGFGAKLW